MTQSSDRSAPSAGSSSVQSLILRAERLSVIFRGEDRRDGGAKAVDGVDLTVHRGEVLALVGESGCGKSATALALMGLLPDDATVTGSVQYDGVELIGRSERELSRLRGSEISMIFQDPLTALNPVITVGVQLSEVLQRHERLGRRGARDRAIELLADVGIPDPDKRFKEYPHQLSGGMRQRVVIAMAIACNPRLLIADEPTTALDTTIQAQILELLKRLASDRDMALVLITHDLGVVAGMADRVLVMYGGRVVEAADRYELFAHPRHRYTTGLLGSLPRLGASRSERLTPIPGSAFDRRDWAQGCAFSNRCAHVVDACVGRDIALTEEVPGHEVRCVNPAPLLPTSPNRGDVSADEGVSQVLRGEVE